MLTFTEITPQDIKELAQLFIERRENLFRIQDCLPCRCL